MANHTIKSSSTKQKYSSLRIALWMNQTILSTNFVFSGEQSPKEFGWCEGGQQGDSCHPGGSHVLSLPATVRGGGTAGRSREEGLADGSPQVRKVRQSLITISYIYILAMRTKTTSWPLVHIKQIRCIITRDAPLPFTHMVLNWASAKQFALYLKANLSELLELLDVHTKYIIKL